MEKCVCPFLVKNKCVIYRQECDQKAHGCIVRLPNKKKKTKNKAYEEEGTGAS